MSKFEILKMDELLEEKRELVRLSPSLKVCSRHIYQDGVTTVLNLSVDGRIVFYVFHPPVLWFRNLYLDERLIIFSNAMDNVLTSSEGLCMHPLNDRW